MEQACRYEPNSSFPNPKSILLANFYSNFLFTKPIHLLSSDTYIRTQPSSYSILWHAKYIYICPTFLAITWKLVSYLWIMNRRFYVPSKSISFRVPLERTLKARHKNRLSEYDCPAGAYQVNERIMSTQRSACPGGKLVAKLSDRRAQFRVSQSLRALGDKARGASDTTHPAWTRIVSASQREREK